MTSPVLCLCVLALALCGVSVFGYVPTGTRVGVPAPAAAAALSERSEFVKGKICIGTNGRMSVPSNRDHHYRNLRDRYTNCTYVDGNLELTWLQEEHLDLSFLQHIREVTGYVLISHVDVRKVSLPRLQIIRGRTTFKINTDDVEFAFFVTLCKMNNLELPALRDILSGSVGMFNNYNLCHIRSIDWDEIITGRQAKYHYVYNFTSPERDCPKCHANCSRGCWGEGVENCQQFSKVNCSPQCWQGRCFGPEPRQCCHLFCAGGCTGPKQSDCLACHNFYDDGVCTQECPPMQRYNPITYSWEKNPIGKYAYGATCVKNCPEHLLKDNGACVRSCPPMKKAQNGECVPCEGPCPKTCEGVPSVHSGNIDSFQGCTIIEGSLTILEQSFTGFQQIYSNYTFGTRYSPMHPDRLEVFSTLKEVTGYVNIQGSHEDFTNLTYFRNLEVIGGRALTEYFASLYIVKTSLKSLGLRSLKKIHSGSIAILENKDLCFAQGVDWKRIKKSMEHNTLLQNNKPEEACRNESLVCDSQCSSEGCWGPGPTNCLFCAKFQYQDTCLPDCDSVAGMYKDGPKLCKSCHEECESTCRGPGPGNCTSCRHVRDGPFCVPVCPETKYNASGECKPCHKNCVRGCSGPENTIGENGCFSCEKAILNGDSVERCLHLNDSCPDGYFYEYLGPQEPGPLKPLAGKAICRKCHPRCNKCTGYGFHVQTCQECAKFKRGEQCEDDCPLEHYVREGTQECVPCSSECRTCYGPDSTHCYRCRNYKVFLDGHPGDNSTAFNCTAICPPEYQYQILPPDAPEAYCSREPVSQRSKLGETETMASLIYWIIGLILSAVMICVVMIFCHVRRKNMAKDEAVKMTIALTAGMTDSEPLRPSNIKPNLATLRIITEHEMRKGGVLGYGAFGTVYRGIWVPENENVKIPVAIKVLREDHGRNSNNEFMDEAFIMASVEHPNLLKLLGVCLTNQMMLITQLMPLGCLLDYVRAHKESIGSQHLLNWCTQIARGMSYLEDKRLVHRDLAARNVLVQTASCVKITDFGLAKLLDYNEEEYRADGGKMPIKWLAIECIRNRIFTHKSDVWAFGVTVWELLTYGGRPYENVPAKEVPELLEAGHRLNQPDICSIDVFMLLIKCWFKEAASRPSFKELAEDFAKMAQDPGRYLSIPGDRYLRLPSYSSNDEKEMLRAALADGAGAAAAVVEADEYLTPKTGGKAGKAGTSMAGSTATTSTSSSPPRTPNGAKGWGGPSRGMGLMGPGLMGPGHMHLHGHHSHSQADSPTPQNQRNWDRELMRCVGAGHSQGLRGDPMLGHRPMRHHYPGAHPPGMGHGSGLPDGKGRDESSVDDDCCDGGASKRGASKREAQVGTLKLDLPLDEDDYLMPSPQGQPATSYMDLIADTSKTNIEGGEQRNGNLKKYPEFLQLGTSTSNGGKPTSVDNLEYHLVNNEPTTPVTPVTPLTPIALCAPTLTLGIPITQPEPLMEAGAAAMAGAMAGAVGVPVAPSTSAAAAAAPGTSAGNGSAFPQPRSSEEESDHEYYNDFDRLQRELQPLKPLRRNETTV